MKTVYGLDLLLPGNTLQEDLARIIGWIADAVTLIDRHQTMLFVNGPEDCEAIERVAAMYDVDCERGIWLRLEDGWQTNERVFSDYGLTSHGHHRFLDLRLAAIVSLAAAEDGSSELGPALEQAGEHAIAVNKQDDGRRLLAVDRHLIELLAGIARAYRCSFALAATTAD
ncbi:hypothetical protein [Paenibacillus glycinis]|uniref:Uncharacterized protein n=1 Tax=Paenibacillus glycinis TaxID=2697035 RepID=A0ABW9XJU0_9BACL|nr:hypothetical protein [Paenibacillus glycinis]NBD22818.1 hypothetical protein [Paenibacillus glycinis]